MSINPALEVPGLVIDLTSIAPNRGGGVERVAVGVIAGLSELEIEVRGLSAQGTSVQWREIVSSYDGVQIEEVRVSLRAESRWQSTLRKLLPEAAKRSGLVGWIRGRRSSAVRNASEQSPVWYPFHRSRASAALSIVTVHDLRVFQVELESKMDQQIISANIESARAIVCSWVHPYEEVVSLFPEYSDKVFRIPLPVLNPGASTVRMLASGSPLRLLFPAYVTPHKNHEVLIRALALFPLGELVCTGAESEPHASKMRALADELGVGSRIRWAGYVSADELEAEYRNAHLLVMPSRWEAASGPVYEAVARNLPFIAGDIAPIRAQVADLGIQNVLFDLDDPVALAALLETVVSDYNVLVARLEEPAERVRSRTWKDTARDYARVFSWAQTGLDKPIDLQGTTDVARDMVSD